MRTKSQDTTVYNPIENMRIPRSPQDLSCPQLGSTRSTEHSCRVGTAHSAATSQDHSFQLHEPSSKALESPTQNTPT
jgi:hypothetical protein